MTRQPLAHEPEHQINILRIFEAARSLAYDFFAQARTANSQRKHRMSEPVPSRRFDGESEEGCAQGGEAGR